MKVKIQNINAATKRVVYDVYKDDGVTLIQSGESADYSASIPDPSTAAFTDFAGVVVADSAAKKAALTAKLTERKTNWENIAAGATAQVSECDSQIADLSTAVTAFV